MVVSCFSIDVYIQGCSIGQETDRLFGLEES
jgi:hypothetical protein